MDSTKLNYLCQFLLLLQCVYVCVSCGGFWQPSIFLSPLPCPSFFNLSESLLLIIPHFEVLWARARYFSGQLRSIRKGSGVNTVSRFSQRFSLFLKMSSNTFQFVWANEKNLCGGIGVIHFPTFSQYFSVSFSYVKGRRPWLNF